MAKNLQGNIYTCYNGKYDIVLTDYQVQILNKLLSGEICRKKFSELRSNTRRYNNLKKSIDLSTVNEVYKHEVRNAKKREEPS